MALPARRVAATGWFLDLEKLPQRVAASGLCITIVLLLCLSVGLLRICAGQRFAEMMPISRGTRPPVRDSGPRPISRCQPSVEPCHVRDILILPSPPSNATDGELGEGIAIRPAQGSGPDSNTAVGTET